MQPELTRYTIAYAEQTELVVPGKRLGRNINHDARSRRFAYPTAMSFPESGSVSWQRFVPPFDQDGYGSCTGNAGVGVLTCAPYWFTYSPTVQKDFDEALAVRIYSAATSIDPFEGVFPPSDTGSDGLSVAKVLKNEGLISGYQHAFSPNAAINALASSPIMIGSDWYEGFDNPSGFTALVSPTGQNRGGHEYIGVGVDYAAKTIRCCNSWGPGWGDGGYFTMTWETLEKLLGDGGDVTILTPLTAPAPVPDPVPIPTDNAAADTALAFALHTWLARKRYFFTSSTTKDVQTAANNWLKARGL